MSSHTVYIMHMVDICITSSNIDVHCTMNSRESPEICAAISLTWKKSRK